MQRPLAIVAALLFFATQASSGDPNPPDDYTESGDFNTDTQVNKNQPSNRSLLELSAQPRTSIIDVNPGEPAATTARTSPSNPVVEQAFELVNAGRPDEARELVAEELENNPDNEQLKDLSKRLEKHDIKSNIGALAKRIGGLFSNREIGDVPTASVAMAAPVSFLVPEAAKPTAAVPLGLQATVSKATFLKMNIKDYAGAERDLTAAIDKDPSNSLAFRLRALTRRFQKKLAEADKDADAALVLNPRDAASHWVKAWVRLDGNDPLAARDHAAQAVALNPKDPDAHFVLSRALKELGQDEASLEELRLAAELDGDFKLAYRRALLEKSQPSRLLKARAIYLGAAGIALLFLGMSLFARRNTAVQPIAVARPQERDASPMIGGFRILRRIGQGGMGVVYEALDETLERKVAIKQMRSEIAGDPRERKRFLKEARLVASLRHANIVEIFSLLEQHDELFLVFEYLPGQTVDEVLRSGKLPPDRALALGRQIAAALDFAHAQGIVHQDLKPANVQLSGQIAKVMDFGIARRVQETLSTMSRAEAVGTPAYMAPEQEVGRFRKETDVYALAICLYEFLAGRPPFSGSVSVHVKAQRMYPPLSVVGRFPEAVDSVISKALDPEPSNRPSSAGMLIGELQKAFGLPS
jgi:tRNA A-37 threonylcarbamoyl transferase component Bud32/tetratricopeptide (TPR) repeat protein